ncbi:MAG TPA: metallophosphoesterase family protein [Thermoanaerobaculia bacterium]|nr:metallophosphoesterase family protein [Thermoanaerobaculia bacterium]
MSVGDTVRLAFFGGIYSNAHSLRAAVADVRKWGADGLYALGDFGAFGPHPDRIFPVLLEAGAQPIQGNYEESLSTGATDCHCGYTDPRDNHFAQLSYDYTFEHTSEEWKRWMGTLPRTRRLEVGGRRVLLVHGSPRKINEFLWESTSPVVFLEKLLADARADVLVCTHTGLHWKRELPSGRLVVNAGVLGRPANDGNTNVWYARLTFGRGVEVEFAPVAYDHETLAREMEAERLPPAFIETIRTGWWTTCLEVLPAKERQRGKF